MSEKRYAFKDPRSILKAYGLWTKKHFGQNFLIDPSVPERIVQAGGVEAGETVFEIGAGLGALTMALANRAGRVVALEYDRDLIGILRSEMAGDASVEIREGNVLDVDWDALSAELGGNLLIYGNLPYHLSTPILLALLDHPHAWKRACFLLQREFAERVAAEPGTKACGALSAWAALWTRSYIDFEVGPESFHPAPKVDSAVLVLERLPKMAADVGNPESFRKVVRALFDQRRKMARKALKGIMPDPEALCASLGIDSTRRGETFSLEELASISKALSRA